MSSLVFESLIINNFKSFLGKHEFKLDRKPGLYYIAGKNKAAPELGPNGVGKSTIWDALIWVLEGKTGRDSRPSNAVIPWSLKEGTCSVALHFSKDGKSHTLKRSRRPNELTIYSKWKHGSSKRVVDQVEVDKLLGVSEAMFRRTVILGQFGSLFLDLGPEKQSQMFNEALNLDLWLKASKIANAKLKGHTGHAVGIRVDLSRLEGRRRELDDVLERELLAQQSYKTELTTKLDKLERRIKAKRLELRALLAEYPTAPKESPGGRAPRGANYPAPNPKTDPQGRPGKATEGDNGARLVAARQGEIARLEDSLNAVRAQLRAEQVDLSGKQSKRRELLRELDEYQSALENDQVCPSCGQKAPKGHLAEKIEKLSSREKKVYSDCSNLLSDVEVKEKKLDRLEKELKVQRRVLDDLRTILGELTALQKEQSQLVEQDNPHEEAISSLKKRMKKLKEEVTTLEAKGDEVQRAIGVCSYWADSFKEIRLSLIDQVLVELEMAVTRHAELLGLVDWRVEFQTERIKADGGVSTAFTILLYPPGKEEPVKFESYSGGESQRMQLAVAFGLSEIILTRTGVAPNLEVLDEPSKGLSPEGVEDLLAHLAERAKELGRAIYVVEHHSLERGMFTGTIIVQRDKSGSRIIE